MTTTERRFGATELHILRDGTFEAPTDYLIHMDGDAERQRVLAGLGSDKMTIPVNCFLLRGPDGITLVDAGLGASWGESFGRARGKLHAAGILPEHVDHVLLTHLHTDHALGLLEGDTAFLPRAEVLVPETDLAYFTDASARAALPEARQEPFDITARLLRAYGERIRAIPNGPVAAVSGPLSGIEAVPLPGHTPGHTGYLLRGPDESLLIWADTVHQEAIQGPDPKIGLMFDTDPAQAMRTRLAALERSAREGLVVAGNHIFSFSRVQADGEAFRIVPV